jgi:hypothetical protein
MTAEQGNSGFIDLYERYRVGPSLRQGRREARRGHFRRLWLLAAAVTLFAGATVAEVLAATKVAVVIGSDLAAGLAVAGLALVAGIVMSAAGAEEQASAGLDTLGGLDFASRIRPGADSTEGDVADWVRRVEAALGQADPGPDPPAAS